MGIFILLIVFIVAGCIGCKRYCDSLILGAILGFMIWGLISLVLIISASISSEPVGDPWEVEQYKIQGLEDSITTTQETFGAFVLGCGFVSSDSDTNLKYYYFKVNDIGKQLESIEIDNYSNTYIRETNDVEPCLIHRYQKRRFTGFYKWFLGDSETEHTVAEILVVPTNTIKIEYNVDI